MSEQIGVYIILFALANAVLLWGSLRKELYRRLLFILGLGFGLTGIGLMTLAAKIEEGVTSISDPKLKSAVDIALVGIAFVVLGFNNVFFAFVRVVEKLKRV